MRVTVAGRAVMDRWENAVGQFEALKIQANRIAILPHRITMVNLAPSQGQSALQNQPQKQTPVQPLPLPGTDAYSDPDAQF